MLDEKQITIGKLKQAYNLSGNDVDALMAKLLPDKVFPYILWKIAYDEFWHWSIREATQRYKLEEPQFPDAGPLPKKYFTTSLHRTLIVHFFENISKTIEIAALEAGFNYIIEATYDEDFPFKERKESLFRALRQEECRIDNWQRTSGPLKIESLQSVDYFCISESFPDTIVVDIIAAIRHFRSYPFRREVKGITQRLVDYVLNLSEPETPTTTEITAPPAKPAEELPQGQKSVFRVPASLWEWKSDAAVRDAMKGKYPLAVIAFVLVNWCGITKAQANYKTPQGRKTHVGRLLAEKEYKDDKSYRNFIAPLLEEAASYTIIKA